ncbi:hypothetical protein C8R47DRAFT_496463 [Mycena vitilis]|nr:hypothetical protein C8R47DRAFT_496463 [Mycena vitilis]
MFPFSFVFVASGLVFFPGYNTLDSAFLVWLRFSAPGLFTHIARSSRFTELPGFGDHSTGIMSETSGLIHRCLRNSDLRYGNLNGLRVTTGLFFFVSVSVGDLDFESGAISVIEWMGSRDFRSPSLFYRSLDSIQVSTR